MITVGSLFSGIGGLDLGLERAGMDVRWMCERDDFCRGVLAERNPTIPIYDDVRVVGKDTVEPVDLICGGFPCQPVSLAGRRKAQEDARWLWPEFARIVGELRPRWVLAENVPGLASRGLADVVSDLAALGYDAEWEVVSAAALGAPHIRERLFIVAYPRSERRQQDPVGAHGYEAEDAWYTSEENHFVAGDGESDGPRGIPGVLAHADASTWDSTWPAGPKVFRSEAIERLGRRGGSSYWRERPLEPGVRLVAHGVPSRLARLAAGGNAVVPQVAEFVGRLIVEADAQ